MRSLAPIKSCVRALLCGVCAMSFITWADSILNKEASVAAQPEIETELIDFALPVIVILAGYFIAFSSNRGCFTRKQNHLVTFLWYFVGMGIVGLLLPAQN